MSAQTAWLYGSYWHTTGEDSQVCSVVPVAIVTLYVYIASKDYITLSGIQVVDWPCNVPRARF